MNTQSLINFVLEKIANFSRLIGSIIFLGIIVSLYGLLYFSNDIPDYSSLHNYNPPTITRLYAQNLSLLTEYAHEPRIFVNIDNIPKQLINAFISAEDKTFFENYGIDPMGILRSAIKNIENFSLGKRAIGASTITQQVVQSFIIGKKRTIDRKIAEAILSYRISMKLSKDKILELYLNQIFLGNNSYGVAEAANTYFNKDLNDLTIAECAMLASLPKAPSSFNPYTNAERLIERRNWVLQRMYDDGLISANEMIENAQSKLNVVSKHNKTQKQYLFYTEEVKKQLIDFYGESNVYTKGLVVNTNLDIEIQEKAENALKNGIEAYDKRHGWRGPLGQILLNDSDIQANLAKFSTNFIQKNGHLLKDKHFGVVTNIQDNDINVTILNHNEQYKIPTKNLRWIGKKTLKKGDVIIVTIEKDHHLKLYQIPKVNGALVVIENYTGKILALIGGYNSYATYFNRATQAQRQPGSAYKTLIYLAAIENGFSKDSILMDEPIEISQGKGMPNWRPQNLTHEFNGAVTMQDAFTRSLNIPAIQIGLALGLDKIYEISSRLGVYSKPKNSTIDCRNDIIASKYCKNYSLLLGSFETTLLQLTSAYATIASSGYEIIPSFISSIYDNNGALLYKSSNMNLFKNDENIKLRIFAKQLIHTSANAKILEMLKHNLIRQSQELKLTVAGKTGTTNDSYDTWFVGSTKDFTVGIFVGYDLPKSLGKKEIGATVARPIFMEFIKSMSKNLTDGEISVHHTIEMINTGEELKDIDEETIQDLESVATILKKKPEIELELYNTCPDCEDAYSVKNIQNF